MKSVQYLCIASVGVHAQYHPTDPVSTGYGSPAGHAPHHPSTGHGYESPTTAEPTYEEKSVSQFGQYWDNSVLCDAEFRLDACLLNSKSLLDFFNEQRIADCTVLFVQDLCGRISASPSKSCDNGHVKLTEDNCPTAAFANAFLVVNRIISELDQILGNSMPSFDQWTFATNGMATAAARNNADCTSHSFFHYLGECAKSELITKADMECVEASLANSGCTVEDGDSWTLPTLLARYGLDAANTVVEGLEKTYGSSEAQVLPALREVMESLASMDSSAMHTVSTSYNNDKHESSIDVCPKDFVPMNAMHYRGVVVNAASSSEAQPMTGPLGLREELVYFHFPSTIDAITGNAELSPLPANNVPLDPLTNYTTIYDDCESYFEATKVTYFAKEKAAKAKTVYKAPTHEGNQCYSISGYNLHFLESGRDEPLDYQTILDASDNIEVSDSGGFQCFKASWHEAQTCSSHLTKWQMKVACCKSYGTVAAANAHEGHTDGYYLLQDGEETSKYTTAPVSTYPSAPPQYDGRSAHYSPSTTYIAPHPVYPTAPPVIKLDKKSMMFEHYVDSNSEYGSLGSQSTPENPALALNVFAKIDAAVAEQLAYCAEFDLATLAEYTYGYGYDLHQLCIKYAAVSTAIDAFVETCECSKTLFCDDGSQQIGTPTNDIVCACDYTCPEDTVDGTVVSNPKCDAGSGALHIAGCPLCACSTAPRFCRNGGALAVVGITVETNQSGQEECVCEFDCENEGEVCPIGEIPLNVDECECACLSEDRVCMGPGTGNTLSVVSPFVVVRPDSTACECSATCDPDYILCKLGTGITIDMEDIACVDENATPVGALLQDSQYTTVPEYVIAKSFYMTDYASKTACHALSIELDFTTIIPLVNTQCFPQSCILAQLASCMEIPEKEYSTYGYEYVTGTTHQTSHGYTAPPHHTSHGYTLMEASASSVSSFSPLAIASVGVVSGMAVLLVAQYVANTRRQTSSLLG